MKFALLGNFDRLVEMVFEPRKARKNTKTIGEEWMLRVEILCLLFTSMGRMGRIFCISYLM